MQKIIHLVQFIFIKLLFTIFSFIGYKNSSNFGFYIGKIFGGLFRSKKSIINNLKTAGIDSGLNHNLVATNVLGNYGRIFAEYIYLKNFKNNKLNKYISIDGLEILKNIKKENKRVVFISGHFNNFELMAMQIDKIGIDLSAVYRPLNNKYLNNIMEDIRINQICKKQIKKGRAGSREIIKNLSNGSSIAIMIDQRVREGEKVNFFNKLASTTTIPAQLAKKYNCEIVPIYIERYNDIYFKMKVLDPLKINENKTTIEITLLLNKILEKMILKNIDQWIWTHNRWKI